MPWAPARYKPPVTPEDKLADQWWRLCHLYRVVDERSRDRRFVPNVVQTAYYWDQWLLDLILKSRQHGITTFLCLLALDYCIFRPNFHAHLIAHTREDSERLFEDKIRWPLDQLGREYPELATTVETTEDNARVLRFPNGSTISCGTSMRGGTLQWLHISEYGKICAQYPHKAKEIRTGALNTVHAGHRIVIESTAEGRQGDFYDYAETARKMQEQNRGLTKLDFKFHFFPWWRDPKNTLDPREVVLTADDRRYFAELKDKHGIRLTPGQKAWYVKKAATQRDLMMREHPSTAAEAFEGAIEGTVYGATMRKLRNQGRIVPDIAFSTRFPVDTTWDLGKGAHNAIWLHQFIPMENMHRWLWFLQSHRRDGRLSNDLGANSPADHVAALEKLRAEYGFVWGNHYLPHDVEISDWSQQGGVTRRDILDDLGLTNIVVVERVPNIDAGIAATALLLESSVFSERGCAAGIAHLESYHYEWNEKVEAFDKSKPVGDQASHASDALRQLAQEWSPELTYRRRKPKTRSWRTA